MVEREARTAVEFERKEASPRSALVRGSAQPWDRSMPSTIHAPLLTEAAAMPSIGMGNPISILGSAPWPDEPWWRRIAPSTLFVLLSVAIAVFFLLHELVIAKSLGFPTGESWVRLVYAHNFFHHLAFEYAVGQPGARPTSPFWIVVLSIAVNLFHDPILASKLLGSIFLFLTGYYAFRLLRTVKLDYASALLGGVLIVTSVSLAWSELSGLESTLSTALVVGGLWWHFGRPNKVSRGFQSFVTGAIFALATLTRPEIAIILLVLVVWEGIFTEEKPMVNALLMLFGFVVVLAPVGITNIAVGGSLVPMTFRGALGENSVIRLGWHGNLTGILSRLLFSLSGIWATIRDVYLADNPVWIFTIIFALWSRHRNPLIERDSADDLFSISVIMLIAFPYLRALALGVDDAFGEYLRLAHFLVPIYTLAGILSLRILARRELFRSFRPKQIIFGLAGTLAVSGLAYILLFERSSASPVVPVVNCGLLLFFTALLFLAGLRHAGIPFRKRETASFVTEEERNKMKLTLQEDSGDDVHLSAPAVAVLNAALLISLAWNLAILPHAANDFGAEVREINRQKPAYSVISRDTNVRRWAFEADNLLRAPQLLAGPAPSAMR